MAFIDPDQSALEWKEPKDASFDFELPCLKIKNFCKVIKSLGDVRNTLYNKTRAHGPSYDNSFSCRPTY